MASQQSSAVRRFGAGAATAAAAPADQNRVLGDLVPPPAGSTPWESNDQIGPSGILTLDQFAVRYTQADRQRVVSEQTTRGFQYAVRENWNTGNGQEVDIVLLQFATAIGAQSYTLGHQSTAADEAGTGGTDPEQRRRRRLRAPRPHQRRGDSGRLGTGGCLRL
jgi:hypothetical protein